MIRHKYGQDHMILANHVIICKPCSDLLYFRLNLTIKRILIPDKKLVSPIPARLKCEGRNSYFACNTDACFIDCLYLMLSLVSTFS